jgi:hypothetical protein
MLYKTVSLAFCAQTAMGYAPAMPTKIASSRVARASDIEMAKKSVRSGAPKGGGELQAARGMGWPEQPEVCCCAAIYAVVVVACSSVAGWRPHGGRPQGQEGPCALRPERAA